MENFSKPQNILSNLKDLAPVARNPANLNSNLSIIIENGIVKDLEVKGNSMTFEEMRAAFKLAQQIYEKKVLEEALETDS